MTVNPYNTPASANRTMVVSSVGENKQNARRLKKKKKTRSFTPQPAKVHAEAQTNEEIQKYVDIETGSRRGRRSGARTRCSAPRG